MLVQCFLDWCLVECLDTIDSKIYSMNIEFHILLNLNPQQVLRETVSLVLTRLTEP